MNRPPHPNKVLSSAWLGKNPLPMDGVFRDRFDATDNWGPSEFRGSIVQSDCHDLFIYATAQPLPEEAFERAEETETPKYTVVRVDGISQVYRYGERRGPANNCEAQLADDLADMTAQRDANAQRVESLLLQNNSLVEQRDSLNGKLDAAETERDAFSRAYEQAKMGNACIAKERDKLRAEVEHRTKQRDAFQNLFSEASEAFNERGRQIASLTTELDAMSQRAVDLTNHLAKSDRDRTARLIAKHNNSAELAMAFISEVTTELHAVRRERDEANHSVDEANHSVNALSGLLNNCADTLRSRGIDGSVGPLDVRVIALAKRADASQARCGELERALGNLLATSTEEPPLITSDASHTDYCVRQIEAEDAARKLLTPSQQPDNFDSSSVESSGDSPAQHPQDVRCHRPNSEQSDGAEVFGKPAPVSVQLNNEVSASPAVTPSHPEPEHVKAGDKKVVPFDLNRALAGARVVTRDGREVEWIREFSRGPWKLRGKVGEYTYPTWTLEGLYYTNRISPFDLFMAEPAPPIATEEAP